MTATSGYALIRPMRLDVDLLARAAGVHPELVHRFVALGLLDADRDHLGRLEFRPDQVAAAARLQRLRLGLSLNYAALGVVADLLDRIAELEASLRTGPRRIGGKQ